MHLNARHPTVNQSSAEQSPLVLHFNGIDWHADALDLLRPDHPARREAARLFPHTWGDPDDPPAPGPDGQPPGPDQPVLGRHLAAAVDDLQAQADDLRLEVIDALKKIGGRG
jgi:hypothetical protein